MLKTHISSPTKQHLVDVAIVDSSRNPILLHRHDATETVIGCPNLSVDTIEGLWQTWSHVIFWKNWRSFFWEDVFLQQRRGYCVFCLTTWFFKFQEFWFLPVVSHCFYQLVSLHLFHVLQKRTITNAWTWWFSKFRINFRGHPFSGSMLVFWRTNPLFPLVSVQNASQIL